MKIRNLITYPIKSCKGIDVIASEIDERGLRHDRRLMIVDSEGNSLTQREEPRLALIEPNFVSPDVLRLDAPDMPSVEFDITEEDEEVIVKVWSQPYKAVMTSTPINEWISQYVGRACRLVRIGKAFHRVSVFGERTAHVSFADHFPIVVTTQESLNHLNEKLTNPVQMSRYRPNIVLEGSDAFDEYAWSELTIGNIRMLVTRVCDRCSVTTIEQETASCSTESLAMLSTFKVVEDKRPVFGLHVAPLVNGSIDLNSLVIAVSSEMREVVG